MTQKATVTPMKGQFTGKKMWKVTYSDKKKAGCTSQYFNSEDEAYQAKRYYEKHGILKEDYTLNR